MTTTIYFRSSNWLHWYLENLLENPEAAIWRIKGPTPATLEWGVLSQHAHLIDWHGRTITINPIHSIMLQFHTQGVFDEFVAGDASGGYRFRKGRPSNFKGLELNMTLEEILDLAHRESWQYAADYQAHTITLTRPLTAEEVAS